MASVNVRGATSSSLPADYAIIASHAASRIRRNDSATSGELESSFPHEEGDATDVPIRPRLDRARRRTSHHIRPLNPRALSLPLLSPGWHSTVRKYFARGNSEETPLLGDDDDENSHLESDSELEQCSDAALCCTYWDEFKVLLSYTLPVYGTHLLEYSLVFTSVVAIGHISTTALAAATLGSMTASVTGYSIVEGLVSALDTLLPSYWTSQPDLVGLWSQRMAVVLAASLVPILTVWYHSESILLLLRQEPEIAHMAALYLRWASFGLPAYAFNEIALRYFHSQGLFTVPTRVFLTITPINVLLTYILVWGPPPLNLGFIGAPIATTISFNLFSAVSLFYGVLIAPRDAWYPISPRSFTNLGVLVQLGIAGVVQTASDWWSWELIGLAASLLGPTALASQSVLLVSATATYQAPFALGVAASVRIGNLLGEQRPRRAGISARSSLLLAFVVGSLSSVMFLVFRNSWGYLFNDDPKVVAMVASVLPLVALFQVFDGLAACNEGILRARGKQFTGALLNLSAYYIVGIPIGIWLAFGQEMQLVGLWAGLTISLLYGATAGAMLNLWTDWKAEAEKVATRLAETSPVRVVDDVLDF